MGFIGISHERRMLKRIKRLSDEGKIRELMGLLKDRDPKVVSESLKALGNVAYSGKAARLTANQGVSWIGNCLVHQDRFVRLYAVRTLCWITVNTSATEMISAGIVPNLIPLLSDDEPDTIRYTLAIMGEIIEANQTSVLINSGGMGPIGSLVVNKDDYTSQLAIRLLGRLGDQGYGSQVVASGSARLLLLASNLGDVKSRNDATASLKSIAKSMGYSDIDTFKGHIQDAEKMAGRSSAPSTFEPIEGRSMDAYFSGGATGVNTIEDVKHHDYQFHHDNAETGGVDDFEVNETDVLMEQEFDVDLDIVEEAEREFPFKILTDRLREVKRLSEEGIINSNDYYHIKSRVMEDVELSIKLECMNCYDTLEIDPACDDDAIKRSYRKLASQYHPDKVATLGPKLKKMALEEMTKLNHAKQILMDPERRNEHDRMLSGTWSY
jgi:hypothetical protein